MFTVSKIVWFLLEPLHLLAGAAVFAALLLLSGRMAAGRRLLVLLAVTLLLLAWLPLDHLLLAPLEERFPAHSLPRDTAAVVVLGGYQEPSVTAARQVVAVNGAAERLLALARLAREHPGALIVASGGSGSLERSEHREAQVTRLALADLGLDPQRVLFEDASRNTAENAAHTRRLLLERGIVGPVALVTSAAHMPRAVGCFRAEGLDIAPCPVDWRSTGRAEWYLLPNLSGRLATISYALREWAGLAAYRLLGRTEELFPAP